jgi:hypothetical protein
LHTGQSNGRKSKFKGQWFINQWQPNKEYKGIYQKPEHNSQDQDITHKLIHHPYTMGWRESNVSYFLYFECGAG